MNKENGIKRLNILSVKAKEYRDENTQVVKLSQAIEVVKLVDEPEKPVVPQFVADWFEKEDLNNLENRIVYQCNHEKDLPTSQFSEFDKWFSTPTKNPIETLIKMKDGYEVEKEKLYWAVRGAIDYFRCDEKIITFTKQEEALEVANFIGVNTELEKMNNIDCSKCISIEELRNKNEEPLFYIALPKIGDTEFCYLWTDTDGAVYTQGNKGLCIGRLKHTEKEIKDIDERYWAFAEEVSE